MFLLAQFEFIQSLKNYSVQPSFLRAQKQDTNKHAWSVDQSSLYEKAMENPIERKMKENCAGSVAPTVTMIVM